MNGILTILAGQVKQLAENQGIDPMRLDIQSHIDPELDYHENRVNLLREFGLNEKPTVQQLPRKEIEESYQDYKQASETYWICDYDIPADPKAQRMRFYRGLWRILKEHNIPHTDRSTQSVWISGSQTVAAEIHTLASHYGVSNLYEARKVEAIPLL
jgi:hypothetical protein